MPFWLNLRFIPGVHTPSHIFTLSRLYNLNKYLKQVPPFFALSWVLTWFSHDIVRYHHVTRIFDFLLASHPLMVVYLSCAVRSVFTNHYIHGATSCWIIHFSTSRIVKKEKILSLCTLGMFAGGVVYAR